MRLQAISLALGIALCALAGAQPSDVFVSGSLSRESIPLDATTLLTVTLESSAGEPQLPSGNPVLPPGLEVRARGRPSSVVMDINRQRIYRLQQVFELAPTREGTITIPAVTIQAGGQTLRGNPLTINVMPETLHDFREGRRPVEPASGVPARMRARGRVSQQDLNELRRSHAAILQSRLRLVVCVDNTRPHVGEQVNLSLYLVNGLFQGRAIEVDEPQVQRWISAAMRQPLFERPSPPRSLFGNPFNELKLDPEDYVQTEDPQTGEQVYVRLLRREALWPLQAGEVSVGAIQAQCRYLFEYNDPLLNRVIQDTNLVVFTTDPVTLHVQPLPDGTASAGTIPVGRQLRLNASLSTREVTYDGVAFLNVSLGGMTQPSWLRLPEFDTGDAFRVDPPPDEPAPERWIQGDQFGGQRQWQCLVHFNQPGEHVLPPISLRAFDTEADQFITLSTEPIEVAVSARPSERIHEITNPLLHPSAAPLPASVTGDVLLEIETGGFRGVRVAAPMATQTATGWVLIIAPALVLAAVAFTGRRRSLLQGEAGEALRMRRKAARHLRAAERARRRGDAEAFHTELAAAVHGHMSDRLGRPTLGAPWAEINATLASRGVAEDVRQRLHETFDRTEYARFAPGADPTHAMDELHVAAIGALRDLSKQLSAKRGNGR